MKKYSFMLISVLLLVFGVLFSACTPKNSASITLNKTSETIYLGETENNEVSIIATTQNIDVKNLDLIYDTTYINISQTKNKDGSFTIVVSSKVNVGTNAIAVEVKAGNKASAVFYIDIVLPIERIVTKEGVFVAYNGQETKYNLLNCITFEPAGTKQTDVEFTLVEESENYSISGNILTINENLNLTTQQIIKVDVASKVKGKSDIVTQLNLKIIPNVELLANKFTTLVDYNGEEKVAIENKTYELSITKTDSEYFLNTFIIYISVPRDLGINVDIDTTGGTNILNYLSYSKMHTIQTTYDLYIFTFDAKSGAQGEGDLSFKFSYKDYPSEDELSSSFVGYNNEIIKKIPVVVTMPITDIEIKTDCSQNETTKNFILYKNYNNALGEAFRFVALPEGTSQKSLILQKTNDSKLSLHDSKGNLLKFIDNKCEIMSGDLIYIKGGELSTENLKCYSALYNKATISIEVNFSIIDGATDLGFVDSNTSIETKEEISLNVEIDDKVDTYIYAPGIEKKEDFTYDNSVELVADPDNVGYFKATFFATKIGRYTYTFATANGYLITAYVNVIQPITNAYVVLKDKAEYVSGIGQYDLDKTTNELLNISIENGYSAELDFIVNQNASISKIRYSFYNPSVANVYDDYFASLKIQNADEYDDSVEFEEMSSILNTQSLVKYNLVSANFAGVNIVKIEIFGQSVKDGVLVDEIKTKFLFIQVYNPVKSIVATAKNITLRASNQLSSANQSLSTKTLSIDVLTDGEQPATYNKLFIDGGLYEARSAGAGKTELICSKSYDNNINVVYNFNTGKLRIDASYVDSATAKNYQLVLFAGNFIDFANGKYLYRNQVEVPYVLYIININLIETNYISDISISNLTLADEDENSKTYNTIYIDTSKSSSVTYKLFTQIEPIDAFDKELLFQYTSNSGSTQAMLDIASDGTITVLGQQGGTGVITIRPAYLPDGATVKTINIPIVVTDGNSWETAYEITSLDEIIDPNKHYVLTIPTTYTLTKSLFENLRGGFNGGLYGKRYQDTTTTYATIKLEGVSLFNELASSAHIACLNICGDVNATEYINAEGNATKFTYRGFVANVSSGTIENVKITTFVENGIYVPSLLTIGSDVTAVGGIVGKNSGTIKNCTFAGSINIEKKNTITANAIAGSNNGTIENCNVIIAKFDSSLLQEKRVIQDGDNGDNYINGVIGDASATNKNKFKDIANSGITELNYADYVFDGNVGIAKYSDDDLKFSYGEVENAGYGLVFYYKAKQTSKQSKLDKYNTIAFENLFSIKTGSAIKADNLKVTAFNADGTVCNFIIVNSNNIKIDGIGEFVLKITSEFDYTKEFEIKMLSLYYASNFSISSNGSQINSDTTLKIVYERNQEIITRLNNFVTISKYEDIELYQNDFNVLFDVDYITNNKLGSHTINMLLDNDEIAKITAQLLSGHDAIFDILLKNIYLDGKCNSFNIQRKNGTTDISASISEGAIEPKDTLTFVATLTTDLEEDDKITENTISIFNEFNINITKQQYFTIFVEKLDSNNNDSTFKISISVNNNKLQTSNLLQLVNKTYKIVIKAINNKVMYDSTCEIEFTLLPQTIANINTTLYNITSLSTSGFIVSNSETPTSVLIPSLQGGLFVIDMFPSYASYDHIEVVATANTMSKLSFRLQQRVDETNYVMATSGYEAVEGQNGIRIFNTIHGDVQNIGIYYLKVFADASTFTDNTIFTITVSAFYNDEELSAQSIFTLHMRMPDAPQLSLNGQTTVYALAGQTISNITCLIANDQINPVPSIAKREGTNNSVIDDKDVRDIHIGMVLASQNDVVGYKKYIINIMFDEDYIDKLDKNSTKFKLVVTSTKIANGNQVQVYSEMNIYLVDYTVDGQDIVIYNATENTFKVTSIKSQELKLADIIYGKINATKKFVDEFNENYYFFNEQTGFSIGSNIFDRVTLTNKAQILASYISYVNGNVKTPLLKVNASGNLEVISTQYLSFDIENRQVFNSDGSAKKDESGLDIYTQHLMVRGGSYTGTTNMILELVYNLPDGRIFTYEYKFDILNSQYTSEDFPKEISNSDAFLGIENEQEVQDYILTNDLYLYDFKTINNTDKISYLDGNNHTINIISFAEDPTETNFALFNQIASRTTIKNLTVNLYHLKQIVVGENINANIAGFAIQNNGAIYNCEVVTYKNSNLATTSSTYGIKVNENANVNVAGFVLNNNGSITNSRVGGTSKLITNIEYIKNEQDIVTNRLVREIETPLQMFTIRASGTISGFVETNNGVIASSFVKNVNIQNTYFKQELKATSGFANTNAGTIALSYVEGDFLNKDDVQSELGGMEGSGIMSGFVYVNSSKISDSYSNIKLTNTKEQVGRLGAGFVFENTLSGAIERCYSASKVISNNITQMNFAGIKDFGGYNNEGIIKTSYYYIRNSSDTIAIDSVLNTSINAVSDMGNVKEFYGYSFKTDSGAGTWIMDNVPHLVSPDDISHSLRAKYENPNKENDNIDYFFEYCDGYELGSVNNPIIIRDAQEFNSVFGASASNNISDNYSLLTKKVYGTYRIVNNIDMLELVPEEEQETEYKVNLVSTKMTLSGEYVNTSNKNGSLNGNGLTISNLAISNASTTSDGFGLFKSLENGASICNLNVIVSSAGVSADHTVFVGTLAGTLKDSYAYNINVQSENSADYTLVIGANVTGGVFGRVVGDSNVSNISISNMSAIATYNTSQAFNADDAYIKEINVYNRKSDDYGNISIAGGAFGVIDIYDKTNENDDVEYGAQEYISPNVTNISVAGGMKVEGMTAGGIAGFIGNYVIARDLSLTVLQDALDVNIIAYNCFAGGIAGYNKGFLYQVKAEHEKAWQDEIEANIHAYYTVSKDARNSIDRGSLNIFDNGTYKPYAIGGLVGYANGGKISIGYSKLNVINEGASYIGGLIGYVCQQANNKDSSDKNSKSLILYEVYAVGDVYSSLESAYIGGLIGKNNDDGIKITKVNAMNYWGYKSYELFKAADSTINSTMNGYESASSDGSGETATEEKDYSKALSIKSIQFAGEDTAKEIFPGPITVLASYYSYQGVLTDNGAQIDEMFKRKDWYTEKNWSRDLTEMFPHILYVIPKNIYEIGSTNDFYKFILYGNDPDVTFVVIDSGTDDNLVNCSSWQTTLGLIRGDIVGATSKNGFKNLNVPLFTESYGNSISNLTFQECDSAFVQTAKNTNFRDLIYNNCQFNQVTEGNLGGVAQMARGTTTFSNILFSKGCLLNSVSAKNAGFLFGSNGTGNAVPQIQASDIKIDDACSYEITATLSTSEDYNYGLLFGNSTGSVEIKAISISDKINVKLNGSNLSDSDTQTSINICIGIIAGNANGLSIDLQLMDLKETDDGLYVEYVESKNLSQLEKVTTTLQVGGIVGQVGTLTLKSAGASSDNKGNNEATALHNDISLQSEGDSSNDNGAENNETELNYISFAPTIKVQGVQNINNLYLGTACGNATTLKADNNIYIFGQSEDSNGKKVFKTLGYDFAQTNFIGGIAGSVNSVTGNGVIAYYGDMIVGKIEETQKNVTKKDATSNPSSTTKLNIGGLFGTTTNATISNALFDGTISFADEFYEKNKNEVDKKLYLRVGGVVGYNPKNVGLDIKNSVVAGEIILSNNEGKLNFDAGNHAGNYNVAGIVGLNEGTLTLGSTNENVIILTTIFSSAGSTGIDMIANNATSGSVAIGANSNVKYCSSLTLAVSSIENPKINNTSYDQLGVNNENGIWEKIKGNTVTGSKLSPYMLGEKEPKPIDSASPKLPKDEYFCTTADNINTYTSTYLRKLYISVSGENTLEKQISLENAILFSSGASFKTNFTPIHTISADSAVAGLVAKIYIDEFNGDLNSSKFVNYGGLANINNGIIYTCSVQENLNDTTTNSTRFYGYMNTNNNHSDVYDGANNDYGVAGFVAYNTGYIFGSNSNVHLRSDNDIKLNGFVGLNEGTISYCYASGINENNREDLGGLFAGISGTDFEGNFDHCYTIVMAKGTNISEKLPTGVFAEEDAVEKTYINDGNATTLYNNANFPDNNKQYYAIKDGYNYNYPTLSNGPFANFEFLHRCTLVKNSNDGLSYLEKSNTDDASTVYFFQIPNLTVLKALGTDNALLNSHSKFVIISDINVGYNDPNVTDIIDELKAPDGFVLDGYNNSLDNVKPTTNNLITSVNKDSTNSATIKNITFGGEITIGSTSLGSSSATGIFGSVGSGVTLDNIKFVEANITINTNNYSNTSSNTSYVGVLVGKNNGTVQNCEATYNITSNGGSTTGYTLGGLVGLNTGTVTDCSFSGTVFIDEPLNRDGKDHSVIFGGIIGKNQGTATKLILASNAKINELVFTSGGEIYKNSDYANLPDEDKQKDENKEQQSFNAQIYVRTNNKAIVGGIVGQQTDGCINMSYTNKTISQYAILVGDECHQMIAYAGGIAGIVTGGNIQDCANLSNIGAMSVWQFTTYETDNGTTQPTPKANYEINESGIAVECNNKSDYSGYVYYLNANSEPTLKYDGNQNIYVYREMTSLAFAGGIAGAGITSASTNDKAKEGNVRLVNYGYIAGGFRAIKPIFAITAERIDAEVASLIDQYWKSCAYLVAHMLVPSLAWRCGEYFSIMRSIANALSDILSKPTFNFNVFSGNSYIFHNESIWKRTFNTDKTGEIAEQINTTLGFSDNFKENELNKPDFVKEQEIQYYKNLENFYCASAQFDKAAHLLKFEFLFDSEKYTWQGFTGVTRINMELVGIYSRYVINNTFIQFDNEFFNNQALKSCSYDGICPDLGVEENQQEENQQEENKLIVYSNISNFSISDSNYYLHSVNYANGIQGHLAYAKGITNYKSAYASIDELNWNGTDHSWYKKGDCYIPGEKSELEVGEGDNPIIDNGDTYSYTVKNSKNWEAIVDTINANKDNSAFTSMQITVNLAGGEKAINVNDNTLDVFNGSIKFNSTEYYFYNLHLTNEQQNGGNLGLIKETTGCTLKNVRVDGDVAYRDVSFSYFDENIQSDENTSKEDENTTAKKYSAGVLIGKVTLNSNSELNIDNSNIKANIEASDNDLLAISNMGGMIGSIEYDSDTKINSGKIAIKSAIINNNISVNSTEIEAPSSKDDNNSFGGIIGSVSSSNTDLPILIDNVSLSGEISLLSKFNHVGGIIGNVGNNVTLTIGDAGTSNLNVDIKASSNRNIYVGGIVGCNQGTINIAKILNISTSRACIISADVTDSTCYAYAGGFAGCNAGAITLNADVSMGKSGTSYDALSYIFAGFNIIESGSTLPHMSNADRTVGLSVEGASSNVAIKFTYINTIARYIYRESVNYDKGSTEYIGWDNVDKGLTYSISGNTCTITPSNNESAQGYVSLFETETTTNGNYLESEEIQKDEITLPDGTTKTTGATYSYKPDDETGTESKITLEKNIISSSTQKLAYSVKTLNTPITSSKVTNVVDYHWLLSINYQEEVKRYNQTTSDINATYKFLISLTTTNAKLNDSGKYLLVVTKLNDYEISEEFMGTVTIKTKDKDGTLITGSVDLFKKIYKETTANQVLLSTNIILEDNTGRVFNLGKIINETVTKNFNKNLSDTDNKTAKALSGTAVFKHEYLALIFNKKEGQINFTAKEEYSLSISGKYSIGTIESGKLTNQTSYPVDYEECSYNRYLINTNLPTGNTTNNTAKFANELNPANKYVVHIENENNTTTISNDTYTYTQDSKLNDTIDLKYHAPTYRFNNKDYAYVQVSTSEINEQIYIFVTCVDNSYNITEHVYKVIGANTKPTYCGYIAYALSSQKDFESLFFNKESDDTLTPVAPDRYESLFPIVTENIYNFVDNLKEDAQNAPNLEITYTTYDSEVNIKSIAGDLFYTYRVDTIKHHNQVTIKNDGSYEIKDDYKSCETSSGKEQKVYFTGGTGLGGLLTAKNITTEEEYKDKYSKVEVTASTELPEALNGIEGLKEFYTYNGNLVGYIVENNTTGTKKTEYYYYRDGRANKSYFTLSFYASTGEYDASTISIQANTNS